MFFHIKRAFESKRSIILLMVVIGIIGLLIFVQFKTVKTTFGNLYLNIQLGRLRTINHIMQRNYQFLQGSLSAKIWESKFAMYKDKKIGQYFGSSNPNLRLLKKAKQICRRYNIDVYSRLVFVTYFYRENSEVMIGFLSFDHPGIQIRNPLQ
jgi:hypothetical protein